MLTFRYTILRATILTVLNLSATFIFANESDDKIKCEKANITFFSNDGLQVQVSINQEANLVSAMLAQNSNLNGVKSDCLSTKSKEVLDLNNTKEFLPNVSEEVQEMMLKSVNPSSPTGFQEVGFYLFELKDGTRVVEFGTSGEPTVVYEAAILQSLLKKNESLDPKNVSTIHFFHSHPPHGNVYPYEGYPANPTDGSGWEDLLLSGADTGINGVPQGGDLDILCNFLGSARPSYFVHAVPYRFRELGIFTSFKYRLKCAKT